MFNSFVLFCQGTISIGTPKPIGGSVIAEACTWRSWKKTIHGIRIFVCFIFVLKLFNFLGKSLRFEQPISSSPNVRSDGFQKHYGYDTADPFKPEACKTSIICSASVTIRDSLEKVCVCVCMCVCVCVCVLEP